MKVLLIQNFGGLGGGTRSALDVAKMFIKMGNDVSIIIDNPSPDFCHLASSIKLTIVSEHPPLVLYNFHSASGLSLKTPLRYYKAKNKLSLWEVFFETNIYDLVVLNSSVLCPLLPVLNKKKIKNIVFVRETFRKNKGINKKQKCFLKNANAAVYLTNYDLQQWNMNENSFVVPDIVDLPLPRDSLIEEQNRGSFTILYLGGIDYYKGCLDLLKAFSIFLKKNKPNAILNILGNNLRVETSFFRKAFHIKHSLYRKKCEKLIGKINSSKKVIFVLGITPNVSDYYEECDVVVFPVKKVHQPRPAYEAGFFAKPIIVPDYPNFGDNIFNMHNGLLYKKNKPESLSDCFEKIYSNKALLRELGANNKKLTDKYHSFDYAYNCLLDIVNFVFRKD